MSCPQPFNLLLLPVVLSCGAKETCASRKMTLGKAQENKLCPISEGGAGEVQQGEGIWDLVVLS